MSGFRSRFPTVTPWTTDQDLPDIVFRPCFTAVAGALEPAGPAGAARRQAARLGRCVPARREPAPRRDGSGAQVGAATARLALPQVTGVGAGGAARVQPARWTSARGPRAGDGDSPQPPLAFRRACRASSPPGAGAPAHTAPHQSHPSHRSRPGPGGRVTLLLPGRPVAGRRLVRWGSRAGNSGADRGSHTRTSRMIARPVLAGRTGRARYEVIPGPGWLAWSRLRGAGLYPFRHVPVTVEPGG
jgi:hypothetical protein